MVDKKSDNLETLNQAITTLEEIASNPSTPKNIKKSIEETAGSVYLLLVRSASLASVV